MSIESDTLPPPSHVGGQTSKEVINIGSGPCEIGLSCQVLDSEYDRPHRGLAEHCKKATCSGQARERLRRGWGAATEVPSYLSATSPRKVVEARKERYAIPAPPSDPL